MKNTEPATKRLSAAVVLGVEILIAGVLAIQAADLLQRWGLWLAV